MNFRHAAIVLIATAFASPLAYADDAAAAPANDAPKPAAAVRAPSYTWFEADYGFNYFGVGDIRLRSDAGFRLGLNAKLLPHLYLVGGFDYQDYNGPEFKFGTAGLGTYFTIAPATDWVLNATWENENLDSHHAAGWGAQTGFRTLLTRFGELSVTYKYSEYKNSSFKDKDQTVGGLISLPLTQALDLTMRVESDSKHATSPGSPAASLRFENYLVGFRVRF